MLSNEEIYAVYLDQVSARQAAGFSIPLTRAIEDAAMLLDCSLKDVVVAISKCRKK